MFKIGINSAPRIVPAEESQESQAANAEEPNAPPKTEAVTTTHSSVLSESMFSTIAIRAQLDQKLSQYEVRDRASDRTQKKIVDMEKAINEASVNASDSSTEETDRRHNGLDNIQKLLDIIHGMDPDI
jgi:hypothetical protein